MKNSSLINSTAVTEVYGTGQKVVAAVLEYNMPILAASLSVSCYSVEGRTITDVIVSDSYRGKVCKSGCFVELILDSNDPSASTKQMAGKGRQSRLSLAPISLKLSQLEAIKSVSGEQLAPFSNENITSSDNGLVDSFTVHNFQDEKSGQTLNYNLYIPKDCVEGQKYPLVLFMHDAGSCSDDVSAPLVQGNGAVVWARDAQLGKRPCFVVAPHYPVVCVNDSFEATWHLDSTVSLVKGLIEQFPIDRARIYGTGQSMGCMMLCEMLLRYPGFFAGSLLVAGQWDPKRMADAKDEAIWAVVAAGDAKAFPILGECFDNMEKAGGAVCRGHMDARADMAVLNENISKQKASSCNLNFTWFEGKSILPLNAPEHPGAHHIFTWTKAYDIDALREWLFEQALNRQAK
ncbi:MAG: hypothetical protein GX034_00095 [Clostridiaceae bacterium]|jgi:predicted peptidase|nr:hypothetical protein [Clostridiaceae bacterium]